MQIAACFDKLQKLQFVVFKHHWDSLDQATRAYELEIERLKSICQTAPELPKHLLEQFQHLSTQQRRVMRAIHHAQQMTLDHTHETEHGLQRIQQVKTFTEKVA